MDQSPTLLSKVLKYGFYLTVLALIIFIILFITHYLGFPVFSFSPGSSGVIPIPTSTTLQVAFGKSPATPDISCDFKNLYPTNYTLSMDIFINGAAPLTAVPRVLLYRSSNQIVLPSSTTTGTLKTTFPNSNIIVYMDPLVNDLYVAIADQAGNVLTSKPIQNVPLRSPFRVIIILSDHFLEIYMQGEIVQTMPIPKPPIATPPTAAFWGPPAIVNQSIRVANIMYWNFPLSAKTVRTYGTAVSDAGIFN